MALGGLALEVGFAGGSVGGFGGCAGGSVGVGWFGCGAVGLGEFFAEGLELLLLGAEAGGADGGFGREVAHGLILSRGEGEIRVILEGMESRLAGGLGWRAWCVPERA